MEDIKDLRDITVFIDESGSIPSKPNRTNKYFIITLLFVENKNISHVQKVFKRSRMKSIRNKDKLLKILKENKEIKGSEVNEKIKKIIYKDILNKCGEKFELGIIVLDCEKCKGSFRTVTSRTFNYLIKIYLQNEFKINSKYRNLNSMDFIIDERNIATESKNTLQEYLNTELNLNDILSKKEIKIKYLDSKNHLLLQMADFISNTFYRKIQKRIDVSENDIDLLKKTCKNRIFEFPL